MVCDFEDSCLFWLPYFGEYVGVSLFFNAYKNFTIPIQSQRGNVHEKLAKFETTITLPNGVRF